MNIESYVFPTQVSSSILNIRIPVKLHANACNYQISKFYTRLITYSLHTNTLIQHMNMHVHEYNTQTTCILCLCRSCNPFDWYCVFNCTLQCIFSCNFASNSQTLNFVSSHRNGSYYVRVFQ